MGKRTRAYAAQGYLFNDELEGRAVKEPEEPKKMVVFPVTEFSQKEQAAREHIRRRREMAAAPSTPKAELRPDPLPKRVILTEPAVNTGTPLERLPVTPGTRPPAPSPETAQADMGGPNRVITALIGASGLAAAGMSIYHGYQYLLSVGKPSWVALITAVVMVVFSSTIFAFPPRGRRVFGCALRVLGIATVSFSIFSTVAVNYDQFSAWEAAETASMRKDEAKHAEIELRRVQLEGLEAQIDGLKQEAQYWKDKSWDKRDAAYAALQEAYTERSVQWQALNAATEAAYQVVAVKTIFTYVAGLFHLRKSLLEFIVFCLPAVFYDVLAPLAVTLTFVSKKTKEEP